MNVCTSFSFVENGGKKLMTKTNKYIYTLILSLSLFRMAEITSTNKYSSIKIICNNLLFTLRNKY